MSSTIIQPIYDQLFELLKPVSEVSFKSLAVSITVAEGRVINRMVHVFDRDHSGINESYEKALEELTDGKAADKRKLAAAESEVARLKAKLAEQP